MSEFIDGCSCLTQEDNDLPHWIDCWLYNDRTFDAIPDKTGLRWLAEKAAAKDIDTALLCLRSTRYQIKRLTEQLDAAQEAIDAADNEGMKAELLTMKQNARNAAYPYARKGRVK